MPYNFASLDLSDLDFGAGGPLLPDSANPRLMIAGGKEGGFNSTDENVLNAVLNSTGHVLWPVQIGAALSTAAFFNNTIYGSAARTAISDFGDFPGSVIVSAQGISVTADVKFFPKVNVLTYRYDTRGSGVNSNEILLNPAINNVNVASFGKLYTTPVDGAVYTEPLIYTDVMITAGVNTNAASMPLTLPRGGVLWKRTFLDTTNPGGNMNNTLNATEIVPVAAFDVDSAGISPEIGITGTPVIDQGSNLLYVVPKTKETIGGFTHFVQRLHAINVADGTDAATPFLIGHTTRNVTMNFRGWTFSRRDLCYQICLSEPKTHFVS
ncbi:hypothetical protein V1524DRAFT_457658 [Lipomyces starkeyi]